MKTRLGLLIILGLLVLLIPAAVLAVSGFELERWTIDRDSDRSTGGQYRLCGAVG